MSMIGCASISSQTPMVSNSRRAAATMADARGSDAPRVTAGSATVTEKKGPKPWRKAIARAKSGKARAPDQDIDTLDAAS